MICVHYDSKTGKVLGAYDSKLVNLPVPIIKVTEEQWNSISGEKVVDLKTYSLIGYRKSNKEVEELRRNAYMKESDPLFFQYQRGECTKTDWLNKIDEIKRRYPKSTI